ncbi:MAG: A/G-specific adenine glycosylase, partial [Steroidobacteraceae bacterium]
VLHLWSGLGYYSRARNLQRAAQRIVAEHAGELPDDVADLERLPGIGRSTAAAIVALSHDRPAAILDGNVRRVLSRFFGVGGEPSERATQQLLWRHAEACTPQRQAALYTQAVMDLGATLCTRRRPQCLRCPLSAGCVAYRSGRIEEFPPVRRRAARPQRQLVLLLAVRADGGVLLRRRPPQGVWAALWAPPEFDSIEAAAAFCAARLAAPVLDPAPLPAVRHVFTHFELTMTPLRAGCAGTAPGVMEDDGVLWYNPRQPARIGLPAPIAALLARLAGA